MIGHRTGHFARTQIISVAGAAGESEGARKRDQIDAEAALDGFYVLRTPVAAGELDAPGVVTAYKNLRYVEEGKPDCCHKRVRLSSSGFPSVSELVLAS